MKIELSISSPFGYNGKYNFITLFRIEDKKESRFRRIKFKRMGKNVYATQKLYMSQRRRLLGGI